MSAPAESRPAHPSATWRSYLPFFVFLGYIAFLVSGFGQGLGDLRPLPIYIFLCLLLLTLQENYASDRTIAHALFIFATSAFSIAYAGEVVFGIRQLDFTHDPRTYIWLNVALFGIFLYDLVARRRAAWRTRAEGAAGSGYGSVAVDFGAAAIFFFVVAFLLDLLGDQVVLGRLGLHIGAKPYVIVDLNKALGLHLNSPVNLLSGMDLVLGLIAMVGALLFLVIAGVTLPAPEDGGRVDMTFEQVVRVAIAQILFALRMVFNPLIWLIPAFCVAYFSLAMTRYFQASEKIPGGWLDLINPLSPASRANFGLGLSALVLAVVAFGAMLVAVALVEHDETVVARTLRAALDLGRGIALTLAFFMYTLALINVVVVLLGITKARPFQIGLGSLLALLVGIVWIIVESVGENRREEEHDSRALPSTISTNGPSGGVG